MIRSFLAAAITFAAAMVFALPASADTGPASPAAPVDLVTVGALHTDCSDPAGPVGVDQDSPDIPEPPPPTCVGCDAGYHCENNKCVADRS